MNDELERYLNDHLAGSCGAISMIQDLADRQDSETGREFFLHLKASVEADQAQLKSLLDRAGLEQSRTLQVAGSLGAKAGRLKLLWEGLDPGELGMFEALELLALGIQGKVLLWVMLGTIAPRIPRWREINFGELELAAIQQRDAVEARRIEAGPQPRNEFHVEKKGSTSP